MSEQTNCTEEGRLPPADMAMLLVSLQKRADECEGVLIHIHRDELQILINAATPESFPKVREGEDSTGGAAEAPLDPDNWPSASLDEARTAGVPGPDGSKR